MTDDTDALQDDRMTATALYAQLLFLNENIP